MGIVSSLFGFGRTSRGSGGEGGGRDFEDRPDLLLGACRLSPTRGAGEVRLRSALEMASAGVPLPELSVVPEIRGESGGRAGGANSPAGATGLWQRARRLVQAGQAGHPLAALDSTPVGGLGVAVPVVPPIPAMPARPGHPRATVDLARLECVFAQLQRRGVGYRLGAKADRRRDNPRAAGRLGAGPDAIDFLDCSGLVRYLLFQASHGGLVLPDGSREQRLWCQECEENPGHGPRVRRVARYTDAAQFMTPNRLFIAFIAPWTHGCGAVGHVWLLVNGHGETRAQTRESYGGHGVASRPWHDGTLMREVHCVYELPVKGGFR